MLRSYQLRRGLGVPSAWIAGSCQTLDSIGSSVKLTNMLISTAATMVMPNSWKNLPTMPPMKPIGRNTATIDSVVASTARPISCVPSSAASCAFLPICTWRTMFSRTTMASSMSRPTHRLSAISVTMLIEKPNMYMNRKVPISAIGSVSPVITVERHEFRNRKTMPMVSSAPSSSVRRTLFTDTRIGRELSRTTSSAMPLGSCGSQLRQHRVQAVDHVDGVLALRLAHVQHQRALAVEQRQVLELLRAVDHVGQLPQAHRRAALARDDDLARSPRAA